MQESKEVHSSSSYLKGSVRRESAVVSDIILIFGIPCKISYVTINLECFE